jgi:hypothetical protein
VNDSRRLPWLSGLAAAIVVVVWLIAEMLNGVINLISSLAAPQ